MCWLSNLFSSSHTPMPGQLWYVRGIGKCVIDDLFIAGSADTLTYNARCIIYHQVGEIRLHRIEQSTFLTNSELIVEDDWKEYLQYKQWLIEARVK